MAIEEPYNNMKNLNQIYTLGYPLNDRLLLLWITVRDSVQSVSAQNKTEIKL